MFHDPERPLGNLDKCGPAVRGFECDWCLEIGLLGYGQIGRFVWLFGKMYVVLRILARMHARLRPEKAIPIWRTRGCWTTERLFLAAATTG